MNRIARYLFRECAAASLVALVVLAFMAMLPQVLRLVDMWVNRGVPVAVLGTMISLSIPKILVTVLPMALLVGILLTMGRMAQDSELVVLKACGLSPLQVLRPLALLAILYTGFALWLSLVWLPHAFHQFSVLKKALVSSTTLALKPQTFNHAIPGLTIYVDEQDVDSRLLKGLLIHDQRKPDAPITLTARRGQIQPMANGETLLFLQDGTRHQSIGENQYRALTFATYQMDLGVALELRPQDFKKHLDELNLDELAQVMRGASPTEVYEARMEWHRRFSFPMATLILGLFAVPLGLQQSHRSGRSYGLVVAVVTLICHFVLLSLGETLARKQILGPVGGFWLPNLLMALLTLYVIAITQRAHSFRLAVWLSQSLANLPQRLLSAAGEADYKD
ncbi:MAG: LPS export ABC transporter permease LptF [Magnetococcales bacterium]|nr:LPS export ABC transporter permease LptF [Magnetococcales bacterium]